MDTGKKGKASSHDSAANASLHSQIQDRNVQPELRKTAEVEVNNPIAAGKILKADREKLRRGQLNEKFLELGSTLDPDRPKNDKASILQDTIQILKNLTAEIARLKTEYEALSEESHELTQEKNELKEEKASLKSDIENLNIQYQQRLRVMFPWAPVDPSLVITPSYPFPVPLTVPPGAVPFHPLMQPFPVSANQNTHAIPNPGTAFISYTDPADHSVEQPLVQTASTSHVYWKQDSESSPSDMNDSKRSDNSNNVETELELKIPGSSVQQGLSSKESKGKPSRKKSKTY